MPKNYAIATVMLFLSACASTAHYEKALGSWVGSSVDMLVSRWGPPQRSFAFSNGGRVLEYSRQRDIQIGGFTTITPKMTYHTGTVEIYRPTGTVEGTYTGTTTTYVKETTPVQNIALQCTTRFTANAQGTVTSWAWEGNDCKARKS